MELLFPPFLYEYFAHLLYQIFLPPHSVLFRYSLIAVLSCCYLDFPEGTSMRELPLGSIKLLQYLI